MKIRSGIYLLLAGLFLSLGACENSQSKMPEPHLELGQRISFVGGDPDKTYVVIGYRQLLEDKTEKNWNDPAYIVISYINNQGDMKEGVVHRNAVQKR